MDKGYHDYQRYKQLNDNGIIFVGRLKKNAKYCVVKRHASLKKQGISKNAVMTQIWIAMCVYLIVALLKLQSMTNKSMQQILRLLQLNLFEKRDLIALVRDDPLHHQNYNPNQFSLL